MVTLREIVELMVVKPVSRKLFSYCRVWKVETKQISLLACTWITGRPEICVSASLFGIVLHRIDFCVRKITSQFSQKISIRLWSSFCSLSNDGCPLCLFRIRRRPWKASRQKNWESLDRLVSGIEGSTTTSFEVYLKFWYPWCFNYCGCVICRLISAFYEGNVDNCGENTRADLCGPMYIFYKMVQKRKKRMIHPSLF